MVMVRMTMITKNTATTATAKYSHVVVESPVGAAVVSGEFVGVRDESKEEEDEEDEEDEEEEEEEEGIV